MYSIIILSCSKNARVFLVALCWFFSRPLTGTPWYWCPSTVRVCLRMLRCGLWGRASHCLTHRTHSTGVILRRFPSGERNTITLGWASRWVLKVKVYRYIMNITSIVREVLSLISLFTVFVCLFAGRIVLTIMIGVLHFFPRVGLVTGIKWYRFWKSSGPRFRSGNIFFFICVYLHVYVGM